MVSAGEGCRLVGCVLAHFLQVSLFFFLKEKVKLKDKIKQEKERRKKRKRDLDLLCACSEPTVCLLWGHCTCSCLLWTYCAPALGPLCACCAPALSLRVFPPIFASSP